MRDMRWLMKYRHCTNYLMALLGATARVTWRDEWGTARLRTERKSPKFLIAMATPEGVEPPTLRSEV